MGNDIVSPGDSFTRIYNRGQKVLNRAYLSLRSRVSDLPFWIDYGVIKLPFHGRDDAQEMYYHLNARPWWKYEFGRVSPYIRSGDVVIDVGANLGFMSGIFSTLAGPTGTVHSFEPSPTVFESLSEVVRINKFSNISPYNFGCGREEQTLPLYCPTSSGEASLRPTAGIQGSIQSQLSVRIIKLDTFLGGQLDRLNFMKIDTEGFEDEVLGGATGILRRFKPVIYIELCVQYQSSSENAIRILRDLGYTFERKIDFADASNGENFLAFPADR